MILRSVFWLGVAFLVVRPGMDTPVSFEATGAAMVSAGRQVIAEQIAATPCFDIQCAGLKAVGLTVLSPAPAPILVPSSAIPSAGLPMQDAPASGLAPVPRPRPAWMG